MKNQIETLFAAIGCAVSLHRETGLAVLSPVNGEPLAHLAVDDAATLGKKIEAARAAQAAWLSAPWARRAQLVEALSAAITRHRQELAELITLDAGKTPKEALAEVDSSADILRKTIRDATLADLNGMTRRKERPPAGLAGLITSFNFPLVVANWTIAPSLLAGNAVLWKPSEKTPLAALAYKAIFDAAAGEYGGLLHILIGGRGIGEALVAHEAVDMISATGSVAMGRGIKAALAGKRNQGIRPILELGGNNGVIISDKVTPEHLEWSLTALLNSFLGTSGQRCTNTRRLFVHRSLYDQAARRLEELLTAFIASGTIQNPLTGAGNDYGYGPLIDEDAYNRFEQAKQQVLAEGGRIALGHRVLAREYPLAYYVEPALALMPDQTAVMHRETFAPLLFVAPYDGDIDAALALVNAPDNAGLVNGIYTQSRREADRFAQLNEAGHGVINPPKGTGTPAFGMGFGGNKESGEGEILSAADPLRAFVREDGYRRIAQNTGVAMTE